ncbi:ECF RNA polymerase sigma factor SigM [BD1-7 clade bacterium]|uniref:RNA polymerase sigma factor SigZ n=1 Tax=BD1-7 clade bacterium TaxID=2029982 RepID=A0A5S9PBI8_9GAMM|nr:ECF RNA polymerase sigma factor SigM [BD1-7 clade bacterium]CAA0101152.1 ECF RNA polymerase sigma factor SigM [BD1-7 clade bacterium]
MNFDTLWQDYRQALRNFLRSRMPSAADADDLLQDIMLKSLNNLHTLKAENNIRAWLFQIANHAIADFYRARARQQLPSADDLWYDVADTDDARDELLRCLEPFIHALPEEQAQLLIAVDLKHIQQKALADELDISYSTLKSRVQKSRERLREVFEQCCEFEMDSQGNLVDYHRRQPNSPHCTATGVDPPPPETANSKPQ